MFLDAAAGAGPYRRTDLHSAGLADSGIARALRDGRLSRVCRGMYVPGPQASRSRSGPDDQEAARHILAVRGVLARLGAPAVVSHVSAAVLHGLDVWNLPLDLVHLTRNRASGARRGRDLHLHVGPLSDADVTRVGGIAVTTPARTAIDIARERPFAQALVVADAALRAPHTDRADLDGALRAAAGRTGVRNAARVVAFADGRSASPGESLSRLLFHRSGLPEPVLQREITGWNGERVATVDFGWDGTPPVIGEFDGESTYGRLLRPGQTPGRAVVEEKIREDLLRELAPEVVRWTWRDLKEPQHLLSRLRRRLTPHP